MADVRPLAGCCVAVTRPLGQGQGLAEAIHGAGGQALAFPLIEIAPAEDLTELAAATAELEGFDLAFFVSPNAVAQALAYILPRRPWPSHLRVATVGPGSQAALHRAGFPQVVAPASGFDSEAVLALPEFQAGAVAGRRVVIFRGDGGRDLLGEALLARGARVRHVSCYRRQVPAADPAPLLERARSGRLAGLVLTSSEGVRNLTRIVGGAGMAALANVPVFVPHPRIGEAARQAGFARVVLTGPGDQGVLAALEAHLGCANGPASVKIPE